MSGSSWNFDGDPRGCGIRLVRATESFEPVLLHPGEARALEVDVGQPALMLLRTTFDDSDVPIESARATLRADRCRTLVERRLHEPDRRVKSQDAP